MSEMSSDAKLGLAAIASLAVFFFAMLWMNCGTLERMCISSPNGRAEEPCLQEIAKIRAAEKGRWVYVEESQ